MSGARVMIAAPASGSGKTQITCGILQALLNRGLKSVAFKCGPDYIDPMFHEKVIGTKSRNLDTFFTDGNLVRYLLEKHSRDCDIAIIEGVMGYYDGLSATSYEGSSFELAQITDTNVILVIDCHGASLSIIPMIKGFVEYQENSRIQGVILNRMSENLYEQIAETIRRDVGVEVLGYVPLCRDLVIESRHLGLVRPEEIADYQKKLVNFATIIEKTVNLDRLIKMAQGSTLIEKIKTIKTSEIRIPRISERVTIAVAKDEAFCFYYEDNLDLLREMGAELIEFSPLHDASLPEGVHGILIGGGYPELYSKELSENLTMRQCLKQKIAEGIPLMAECGGFMYLHEWMEDMNHRKYAMVSAVEGTAFWTDHLQRFGYITLTARCNQMIANQEERIKGHEFHHFDSTNCGEGFEAMRPVTKETWKCIAANESMAVGFPHLYYYSNPKIPYNFLSRCVKYKTSKR